MLHLISRRAWKQSQLGSGQRAAAPPAPAPVPIMARKRKRSPSPQETEPTPAAKREKRGRPSKSKAVETQQELPEEEEIEQADVAARPSRNRRKSAKLLEIENEEDAVSTASEKESEPEPAPSKTNRRKSGKAEKSKIVESEDKIKVEDDGGTHMTIVTGKGKKAKTTNIHIKAIKEPKQDEVEKEVDLPVYEKISSDRGSGKSRRKSGKRGSVVKPLPPLDIPSDSNITTVREESGIKLKLIISPKDRGQSSQDFSPPEPVVEEKKKSKRDKGRKSKEKKEEVKPEKQIKAKLVFGDQILSLDGDKVTHSEKPKETSSTSRSKKRKRYPDDEEEVVPPPVAVVAIPVKLSKKSKKGKVLELDEVREEELDVPVSSSKADKKSKKHRRESRDPVPVPEESPVAIESERTDLKSVKGKSHKEKDSKHKDKYKEVDIKLEVEESTPISKDKKNKKKKSKHDKIQPKIKIEMPDIPSRSDLDLSHEGLDSFEDTELSLVIDESAASPSKPHGSSKKKKIKKEKGVEHTEETRKHIGEDSFLDPFKENREQFKDRHEGERSSSKDGHHRSKHKHDKHKHSKHRSSSEKKSKHKKHRDDYRHMSGPMMMPGTFSSPENSDLSTINASALGFVSHVATPDMSVGTVTPKKTLLHSAKSKKKSKKQLEKSSVKKKDEKVRMVRDKDGNLVPKPKKPLSAYMLWCRSTRPSVVAQNPKADFSAISKLMGIKWHQLSDKHKAKWQNMQRKQKILHKNIPTLSAQKLSSRRGSGSSGKSPSKLQPPNMEAIDLAAHLRLLGESLSTVGRRLKEHQGEIEIHGSVSVLLDSTLCALGPLLALTSQVPELDGCSRETHVSTLENIAYIMPGL